MTWERSFLIRILMLFVVGFPGGSAVKNLLAMQDHSSIPGSGRSPGGGHGNPLQYSCLENPMDRGTCGLQSRGSQRVRHDWRDFAHTCSLLFLWIIQDNKNNEIWEQNAIAKLKGIPGSFKKNFSPLPLLPSFSVGYDEQAIILSRQQHRTTAWNTSILLSQKKKKKIARGSNFSQYLVTLENNGII